MGEGGHGEWIQKKRGIEKRFYFFLLRREEGRVGYEGG